MNSLPPELLLEITNHLEFTSDIAALARTSRTLNTHLADLVYTHSCAHENGAGLERALKVKTIPPSSISKLLAHGAGINPGGQRFVRLLNETAIWHASLEVIAMLRQRSFDSDSDSGSGPALPRCLEDALVITRGFPLSETLDEEQYNDPRYMAHYQDAHLLDQAIRYDRVDVVRMLLAEGLDPNIHAEQALSRAAEWGSPELVSVLLDAGCDVNGRDDDGDESSVSVPRTALHRAVSAGKVENIRVLIDAGAHLEAPDPHNGTPLCLAASNGLPEVVAVLVEAGALLVPPLVKGTALFPLLCAAEGGYGAVAEYLLDRIDVESIIRGQGADGAIANANASASASADAGRLTLLGVSAMLGYTGLAQRILHTGYDINRRPPRANIFLPRWTLLRIGADRGHIELVRLFLRHGAKSCTEKPRNRDRDHGAEDVGFCAFDKGQPLARAVEQGHAVIVRILLEAGAPPNIPINRAGTTILQVAAEKKQQPQPGAETDIAQLLLDYGATPTPAVARAALSAGNIALVRQLAARGITLVEAGSDHQDNHNTSTTSTTLLKAAASGGPAALDLLRDEYGMRPDTTVPGHAAPLEIIIRRGDVGTVGYCLSTAEHGFSAVLARNALHLLAVAIDALSGEKLVRMLEVLVAALSSWFSSQSQSHTNKQVDMEYQLALTHALHAAIPRFRLEAIYLLLKQGADVDWRGAQGMNAWDVACSIENREILEMHLEHALTKLGGNLAIFRRYILPIEERAREAGQRAAVKEISYFYYRRK